MFHATCLQRTEVFVPLPFHSTSVQIFCDSWPKMHFPWNRIPCIFQLQSTVGQQALQKCTLMTEAMKESYNVVHHHSDRKRHERQQRRGFKWSPYHCYKANSCLLYRWHALYKANFNLNLQHPNPSTQTSASHAELTLTSIAQFLCKANQTDAALNFLGLLRCTTRNLGHMPVECIPKFQRPE